MSFEQFDENRIYFPEATLALQHTERLSNLANHLAHNIQNRALQMKRDGKDVAIFDPQWCRENSTKAGQMHADVITATYGSTYALPNKDPVANEQAIRQGDLDLYLMSIDGKVTGTSCLVNMGNGTAELGRSASLGRTGNSIIQDMRILDWLTNPKTAAMYHTLFTTLRNAPDRTIDDADSKFIMRGGQAVTAHWLKLPGLIVNGVAPLYLKHSQLEQFTCAKITRNSFNPKSQLFIEASDAVELVEGFHEEYGIGKPNLMKGARMSDDPVSFTAHYPPSETGLTSLVHADVVADASEGKSISECLAEIEYAGSPFTQVTLPIDINTTETQSYLYKKGFQVYGYDPATENTNASLLFGKVKPGTLVVSTHWDEASETIPFWKNPKLKKIAKQTSRQW